MFTKKDKTLKNIKYDQQSVGLNPPAVTLVSLSKTLYYCFVLRMGRKAVCPMCFVTVAAKCAVAPCKPL